MSAIDTKRRIFAAVLVLVLASSLAGGQNQRPATQTVEVDIGGVLYIQIPVL
jgi:hypothetical protein